MLPNQVNLDGCRREDRCVVDQGLVIHSPTLPTYGLKYVVADPLNWTWTSNISHPSCEYRISHTEETHTLKLICHPVHVTRPPSKIMSSSALPEVTNAHLIDALFSGLCG
jgi:hypothetical protein